ELGIGLQQGWAVHVASRQRPAAVVDPEFEDAPVGLLLRDDRDRKIYRRGLAVEMKNYLREPALPRDDVLDVLDRDVALVKPRVRFCDVCLERPRATDASAYGMVQLGLACKRPNQRIELSG